MDMALCSNAVLYLLGPGSRAHIQGQNSVYHTETSYQTFPGNAPVQQYNTYTGVIQDKVG